MSDQPRVADAFLCPRDFPTGEMDRDFARNTLFGPALGSERVHSRMVMLMPAGRSLVTRRTLTDSDDTTFQFPKTDVRHPDTCHDWFVAERVDESPGFVPGNPAKPADFAGPTILIGFKKDNPSAS